MRTALFFVLALLDALAAPGAWAALVFDGKSLQHSDYVVDRAYIRVANGHKTGTASLAFEGPAGAYDVQVFVVPESDGQPTLEVRKRGQQLGAFHYPLGDNRTVRLFTVRNVALAPGDSIQLVGRTDRGALARIDRVILVARGEGDGSAAQAKAQAAAPANDQAPISYPEQKSTGGLPVIPGAAGFGINTRAGRGGAVHRVTNLDESGSGSLRACVEASGPRVCVFEVSGTILLSANLRVRSPYLTLAGQTAPSPGVSLRGAGLVIQSHDVLVQHIRVRPGDAPGGPRPDNRDAITIETSRGDTYNVVLDHVSASWSTDELFTTWAEGGHSIRDVTIRRSLFSEALSRSIHPKGEHSAGILIGRDSSRVTLIGNVFAYNGWRNPLVRDDSTDVVIVNNLIYRSRGFWPDQIDFGSRGDKDIEMRASVVGNSFVLAPGARPMNTISINPKAASVVKLFQSDNRGPLASADPWSVVDTRGRSVESIAANAPPVWSEGLVPMKASQVEAFALQQAGARPADRDPVDRRVIGNIRARKGSIIDSTAQVGRWPHLAVNRRALQLPDDPHALTQSGYTRLELWLHEMAREVEGR